MPAVRTFAAPSFDPGEAGRVTGEEAAGRDDPEELTAARRVPAARRRPRQPPLLFWFLLLAVIAVILLGSYQFRGVIVYRWPETARFYESLGIAATPIRDIRPAAPKS